MCARCNECRSWNGERFIKTCKNLINIHLLDLYIVCIPIWIVYTIREKVTPVRMQYNGLGTYIMLVFM